MKAQPEQEEKVEQVESTLPKALQQESCMQKISKYLVFVSLNLKNLPLLPR